VGSVTISTQGKVIDNVFVFMLGFKPLKIDMDSFWGKSSSIKVALSNSNMFYNDKSYMEKFILESFNGKATNIRSIEGNIVFVK